MHLLCHFNPATEEASRWVADLREALPEARVELWAPGAALADYAVVWRPTAAFVQEQTRLKAMFNAGAGVDALLSVTPAPAMPIVRLEDAGMAAQMGEYVTYAVLRQFREFADYEASQRAGLWKPRPPRRRSDFTIGVLGLGVLGRHVAGTLAGFGFPVRAWTRSPRGEHAAGAVIEAHHGPAGLVPFLDDLSTLVCLLPLTPETTGLVDHARLRRLRPGAALVNVSRGAIVVEEDLLQALDEGQLSSAMLDVFREEPLRADHPFWRHPKVTLTPHVSALTRRQESVAQIAAKIRAWEAGQPVSGIVDRRRGY